MVLAVFFIPAPALFTVCILIAAFYQQWYKNPGYWLFFILALVFITVPLSLQFGIDQRWLTVSQEILAFYSSFTPHLSQIPLVKFDWANLSFSYSLDLQTITLIFSIVYVFIILVKLLKAEKKALFITASAVYITTSFLIILGFVDFLARGFSGQGFLEILTTTFPNGVIFYHIIFNVLPVFAFTLLVDLALKKAGWR